MKTETQIVGNTGMYYGCYRLSEKGWNVMPTARNARGVDIIAYKLDEKRYVGIQVKTLSKRSPVLSGHRSKRYPVITGALSFCKTGRKCLS